MSNGVSFVKKNICRRLSEIVKRVSEIGMTAIDVYEYSIKNSSHRDLKGVVK
jgi:undecaprenyl pyrophosphate synthase